ncbi:MAG: polysaccharide biosynthesis protein [Defluviitaleaceae bacterium]|nr:polysaccharide biosynthesis protein [Defluviitaleaceae bacterium]
MRLRFYIKLFALAVLDSLFGWVSWIGSVFVFTYLFVVDYSIIHAVNNRVFVIFFANIVFFAACGVYKSLWEHPGIGTMLRIITAVAGSSFTVYLSLRLLLGYWPNPGLGVMAFYFLLTFALIPRLYKRVFGIVILYSQRFFKFQKKFADEEIRTLIIGAGDSASTLLLHPSQQGSRPRKFLGILDNDTRKHGYSLHGLTVLGGDEKIPQLVKQLDVHELLIAVPSMTNQDLRRIVRLAPISRCKVRLLTGLSSDKASEMMRDINIGDLLGRAETASDLSAINSWLGKKTVLVTGGGGSIGSEICRQLIQADAEKVIIYDISENNAYNLKEELIIKFGNAGRYKTAVRIGSVQDEIRLAQVFDEFRPSIVFHAAAYKHVPLMEECPRLAIDNNVFGTYRVAKTAMKFSVERFVMISTDKAVNPTNVMGASKRIAELVTLGLNEKNSTEFVCVRFGNVLDSNGSVIPKFKRQIEAGGPITVTHPKIIRYFMTITEAARLVLDAGAMAAGGEIFILDMGEQIKIVDLAENLIRMAGLTPDVDIKIEFTGLRPGEKLFEELLLNEEGLTKTVNEKIFVVKPPPSTKFSELITRIESKNIFENNAFEFLKYFVPEYVSEEEYD